MKKKYDNILSDNIMLSDNMISDAMFTDNTRVIRYQHPNSDFANGF
jgi:hypothetical protein